MLKVTKPSLALPRKIRGLDTHLELTAEESAKVHALGVK